MTNREIRQEKLKAFNKIKELLDSKTFEDIPPSTNSIYHQSSYIVSWMTIRNGASCKMAISRWHQDEQYKAALVVIGLTKNETAKVYRTIERALLEIGTRLMTGKRKEHFYVKYVTPYNIKLKTKTEAQPT